MSNPAARAQGLRGLSVQSARSLSVKVGGAIVTLAMLWALAAGMAIEEFGRFGFGLSLATLLSVASGLGQRLVALRFVPVALGQGDIGQAGQVVGAGYAVVALASGVTGFVVAGAGLAVGGPVSAWLVPAGVLVPVLALSDYEAAVLRAQGSVLRAQVPKDVAWRAAITLVALPAAMGGRPLRAGEVLWTAVAALLLCLAAQHLSHRGVHRGRHRGREHLPADWRRATAGLWVTTMAQTGFPHVSVVVLGLVISPEHSGSFFAAMRLAVFFNLPLLAISVPAAPAIARHWHRGENEELQRVCSAAAAGGTAASLSAWLLLAAFGRPVLALLGPDFDSVFGVLLVASAGYVANVAAGLSADLMTMTGSERQLLLALSTTNAVGTLAIYLGTPHFGELYAAGCVAASLIGWNAIVASWAHRRLGIDPTIIGALRQRSLLRRSA